MTPPDFLLDAGAAPLAWPHLERAAGSLGLDGAGGEASSHVAQWHAFLRLRPEAGGRRAPSWRVDQSLPPDRVVIASGGRTAHVVNLAVVGLPEEKP